MATRVSYKAERRMRRFTIYVVDWGHGSRIQISWHERERGDEPTAGVYRRVDVVSRKPVASLEHALNLAEWAIRQARVKELPEHDPLAFLRK